MHDSKIVWRVERDGVGPYNSQAVPFKFRGSLVEAHCFEHEDTHPCASTEFSPHVLGNPYMHYGLSTRDQLIAWFKGFGRDLDRYGFKVVTYRVPTAHAIVSDTSGQVAYDVRYADMLNPDCPDVLPAMY